MKKKQNELIKYLFQQNKPNTSTEISNALQISVRSVKQYIREINETYDKKIIIPSHSGYEINPKTKSIINFSMDEEIPQTTEERSFYIIKQLVLNHTSHLELFDLCDFLCISYSTIKSLISKMNKMFSSYHIEFICKNDCVYIQGSEKNKRKLISYVINEEAQNSYINTSLLKENFQNIDIDKLSKIISNTFRNNRYYLNDFTAVNLLLHLLIIIDRKITGNELDSGQSYFKIDNEQEKRFLNELQSQLEKNFEIQINDYELFEIYMLFKANANFLIESHGNDLKKVVGDDIINLTKEYVHKISNLYMIDLSNSSFTSPFSLHLKNLIFRASSGRSITNPMVDVIKYNNPIVFDIAIYISLDLMERFNISINEDEAAFLALHIGAELERQTVNKYKVPTILVCPEYYNMATMILNNLMLNFGNQLHILSSVSNEYQLENALKEVKIGIVFSTIPLNVQHKNIDIIQISPFNLSSQFTAIQSAITKCIEAYKDQKLRIKFRNFFEDGLFISNPPLRTKQQVITFLCDKLTCENYVNSDFEKQVHQRENAASTAFDHIAIPHSAEMDAIKTSIAVAISKKGFQWDTNIVHVVFLLAINKADKQTFRNLYESLISLFIEDSMIQEIRNCVSFADFEKLVYSRIDMKD